MTGNALKERLHNAIWSLGVRARNLAKRLGILGPFEPVLLKLAPLLLPPPSQEVEIALPSGMRMMVPPGYPAARSFAAGLYERDVTRLFKGTVNEGMTVVDLGASVGYYTLLASHLVGASGRVYAFEPDAKTYAYLLRNIKANSIGNVVAVAKAVSDKTGTANLISDPGSDERNWLSTSPADSPAHVVQTVRVDDFFAAEGWPSIDLIKMDIEGSEKAALEGMRELSRRNPGMQLIMEWDVTYMRRVGSTVEGLAALLRELGFTIGYVIELGARPVPLAGALPHTPGYYNWLVKKE